MSFRGRGGSRGGSRGGFSRGKLFLKSRQIREITQNHTELIGPQL